MKKTRLHLLLIFSIILYAPVQLCSQTSTKIPPRVKNISILDPLKYPVKAIRKGIEGPVKIEIEVDEKGNYVAHNIVESADELLSARVDPFMSQFKFYAATEDGEAVPGLALLTILFEIERRAPPKTEITIRFLDPELD